MPKRGKAPPKGFGHDMPPLPLGRHGGQPLRILFTQQTCGAPPVVSARSYEMSTTCGPPHAFTLALVMAPSAAEETSAQYLANTPEA